MVVDQDGAVVSKRLCGLHRQQGIAVCWCHFAIGLLGIGQARLGLKAPQIAQIAGGYGVPFFRGADVAKQRAHIVLSGHVVRRVPQCDAPAQHCSKPLESTQSLGLRRFRCFLAARLAIRCECALEF